jgi:hypothetical protein
VRLVRPRIKVSSRLDRCQPTVAGSVTCTILTGLGVEFLRMGWLGMTKIRLESAATFSTLGQVVIVTVC